MTDIVARQVGRWACADAARVPLATHRFPRGGPPRVPLATHRFPRGGPPRVSARAGDRVVVYALPEGAARAEVVATFGHPWAGTRPSEYAVAPAADVAVFAGRAAVRAVRPVPDGQTLWEFGYARSIEDIVTAAVVVSLDGERVWVTVPAEATGGDSDQWVVLDAADGAVLARADIGTAGLGAEAVAHPDGVHIGLGVGEGQDGSYLLWGSLHDGRIRWERGADDRVLVDVAPGGERYLTVDHGQFDAWVHAFPDGAVTASVPCDAPPRELPEDDDEEEPRWDFHGGFVDAATLVLSDVEMDDAQRAGHFVADAASGVIRGEVRYPATVTGYPLALGDGTWLTGGGGHLTRWAL